MKITFLLIIAIIWTDYFVNSNYVSMIVGLLGIIALYFIEKQEQKQRSELK